MMPKGECIYIYIYQQRMSAIRMLHFLALISAQKLLLVSQLLYIVTGTHCGYEPIFCCCCYDVNAYNGSDCGFSFI